MEKALVQLLEAFVTENKRRLIGQVLDERTRHLAVVMEDVYHPHNASAVIRTCDCFGIQDLYITEKLHEYEVNPNVVRGAAKWINLHKFDRSEESTKVCFEALREKKYRIVGTTPDKRSASIHSLDITSKTAIVFGTELNGLSNQAKDQVDELVHIPMYGFTESFNISVSVALVLQTLVEKMKTGNIHWQLSEEERTRLKLEWYQKIVKRADLHIEKFLKERGEGSEN